MGIKKIIKGIHSACKADHVNWKISS